MPCDRIPTGVRPLSARWVDLARDGDTTGDYARPTAAAMALMCAAVNAGLSYADVDALLLGSRLYVDAYLTKDDGRRRTTSGAAVKARRDWDKAVSYIAARPPVDTREDAHQHLKEVREAALQHRWTGRTGPRDKVVLLALVTIGESLGTVTPMVSVRTLCEDTPIRGSMTVARALDSLDASGWISREHGGRGEPTRYALKIPSRGVASDTSDPPLPGGRLMYQIRPPSGPGGVRSDGQLTTPLATAVGVHGATIYGHLSDRPQSRNDLHFSTGFAKSTCGKWLANLARLGLAVDTGAGWVRGPADPVAVAKDMGVEKIVKARADRHEIQRAGYRRECHPRYRHALVTHATESASTVIANWRQDA